MTGWLRDRAFHRGLHGHNAIDRQRRRALLLAAFSFARMVAWLLLILCYAVGFHWTKALFTSVSFVALISLYANAATDYGAGSANLAELTAGDAHADTEHTRVALGIDVGAIETDILQLAQLQPGPAAERLANQIRDRLAKGAA